MTNDTECGNCGEGCSEEDVAMGGICAWCDEAAAADLREQAAHDCTGDECCPVCHGGISLDEAEAA